MPAPEPDLVITAGTPIGDVLDALAQGNGCSAMDDVALLLVGYPECARWALASAIDMADYSRREARRA